eukprot:1278717-Prymnesium_polylepis.1
MSRDRASAPREVGDARARGGGCGRVLAASVAMDWGRPGACGCGGAAVGKRVGQFRSFRVCAQRGIGPWLEMSRTVRRMLERENHVTGGGGAPTARCGASRRCRACHSEPCASSTLPHFGRYAEGDEMGQHNQRVRALGVHSRSFGVSKGE